MEEEGRKFLPPQPAGPEPELGARPTPPPPAPPPPSSAPPSYAPPAQAVPPPQQYPPGQQYPPQQQYQQPQQYQQAWGYAPQPAQPDNGAAVAGFVLSLVSVSLLILSAGLSSVVSLGCSILGIVYSRKGKKKVRAGETTKNAGLAQAGFVVGIVSLCLAVVATAAWAAVLADEDARRDLEREFDNSETIRAGLQVAATLGRVLVT
jgi:hypothetical protein